MEQIRVVELFAGVGGFRLGLEQASSCFQTVWANQWEPSMRSQFAFECYERHFGHRPEHVCQDIVTAKENIPPHDLLVGGFPCQDYSIAKKGARGIEGKKGVLWWEINAILRTHRPRYVLLENVDRLIKSPAWQKGRDFSIILRCFYEAGYAVEWRVINAADYGEAQRRRRTFLFAFRNDTALFRKAADLICVEGLKGAHQLLLQDGFFAPIFPLYGFERKYSEGWLDEFRYLDLKDLSAAQSCHFYASGLMVNGRFYSVESIPLQFPYKPLCSVLEITPLAERYFLSAADIDHWRYLKGTKQEIRHRRNGSTYFFSEGSMAFPDRSDLPARTMLTSEGSVSRSTHVVADPRTQRLRTLTPIECERLNGFPDDWTAGMPKRLRYFTIWGMRLSFLWSRPWASGSAHWPRTSSVVDGRFSWVSKGASAPLWHTTLLAKSSVLHLGSG